MKILGKNVRPASIFFLLGFYILAQFSWWAYLLATLNQKLIRQKAQLAEAGLEPEVNNLENELENRMLMVFGEGMVFLCLLLLGFYFMYRSLKREVAIARQERNFLLSVTHELKSPLASAKLYLQTLKQRDLDKEARDRVISRALGDTERLKGLVDNLLLATRIENKNFYPDLQRVNLSDFIEDEVERIAHLLGVENRVKMDLEHDIFARIDESAFSSVIVNLLENAIKYSPGDEKVLISLRQDKDTVRFSVEDNGPGIPPKERTRVFRKFVRLGNEETRQTKGTGLGLFIVKELLAIQGGKIELSNKHKNTGLVASVELPIAK